MNDWEDAEADADTTIDDIAARAKSRAQHEFEVTMSKFRQAQEYRVTAQVHMARLATRSSLDTAVHSDAQCTRYSSTLLS